MKTCGACENYNAAVLAGERQKGGTCHLKPPTPVLLGVENTPMGPRPHVIPWRPVVGEDERGCADWTHDGQIRSQRPAVPKIDLTALRLGDDDEATRQ